MTEEQQEQRENAIIRSFGVCAVCFIFSKYCVIIILDS